MITMDDLKNLIVKFWFERESNLRNYDQKYYDMYILSIDYVLGGQY